MWTGSLFGRLQGRCTTQPPMPPDRMEAEIWMKMDQSHLNTLIVPVYWETLEPEEGSYDFSLVDSLLEQAVRFKKKLNPALVRSMEECRVGLCAGMDEAGQ